MTHLLPALEKYQIDSQSKCLKNAQPDGKINVGNYVLIWFPKIDDGKLSRQWLGPLRVKKHYSASSYILKCPTPGTTYKRGRRCIRPLGEVINAELTQKFDESEKPEVSNNNEENTQDYANILSNFAVLPYAT